MIIQIDEKVLKSEKIINYFKKFEYVKNIEIW